MGNWITLTGANIRLLDTEKTIMTGAVPLQSLDSCVLSACNYVRGYVEAGANAMEAAPSIPPECVDDASAIARFTYLAQDPTGTLLTPMRQKEYDIAIGHLRDVSKEIATVTQGATAESDVTTGNWGSWTRLPMRTETDVSTFAPPAPTTATGPIYYAYGLTGLTGGGALNVDGITTADKATNCLLIAIVNFVSRQFELVSGAATPGDAGQIAPTDYDATTNNRHWVSVG